MSKTNLFGKPVMSFICLIILSFFLISCVEEVELPNQNIIYVPTLWPAVRTLTESFETNIGFGKSNQ